MICFHRLLNNWGWKEKSTHPHTDHSQMGELKVFTTFSSHVWQNISLKIEKWDDVAPPATGIIQLAAQPTIQRNHLSLSCLVGMHSLI